jgi:hypothetical protein
MCPHLGLCVRRIKGISRENRRDVSGTELTIPVFIPSKVHELCILCLFLLTCEEIKRDVLLFDRLQ